MNIGTAVQTFFNSPAGTAIVLLFALATLDFVLGTLAAIRDKVFQMEAVAAWLRKHIAGRVLPITAVLLTGHLAGGLAFEDDGFSAIIDPGTVLTGIGLTMAAAYIAETVASLRDSLTPKPLTRAVPED
jgi:hypothetical protein